MKKLIMLVAFTLGILSCKKEADNIGPSSFLQEYSADFMIYFTKSIRYSPYRRIRLEYDAKGKIIRRRMGTIKDIFLPPPHQFDYYVFEDLTYLSSKIIIQNGIDQNPDNFGVVDHSRKIDLSDKTLIQALISRSDISNRYDSIVYSYDPNNLLTTTTKYRVSRHSTGYFPNKVEIKYYSFDGDRNLTQVISHELVSSPEAIIGITTETFGDYDNATNPFKHLFMFDDTFYRSLSSNNFRSYGREFTNPYNNQTSFEARYTWDLKYDKNGLPIFIND